MHPHFPHQLSDPFMIDVCHMPSLCTRTPRREDRLQNRRYQRLPILLVCSRFAD